MRPATIEELVWEQVRAEGPHGMKFQDVEDEIAGMSNNRLLSLISDAIEKRLEQEQT